MSILSDAASFETHAVVITLKLVVRSGGRKNFGTSHHQLKSDHNRVSFERRGDLRGLCWKMFVLRTFSVGKRKS